MLIRLVSRRSHLRPPNSKLEPPNHTHSKTNCDRVKSHTLLPQWRSRQRSKTSPALLGTQSASSTTTTTHSTRRTCMRVLAAASSNCRTRRAQAPAPAMSVDDPARSTKRRTFRAAKLGKGQATSSQNYLNPNGRKLKPRCQIRRN